MEVGMRKPETNPWLRPDENGMAKEDDVFAFLLGFRLF